MVDERVPSRKFLAEVQDIFHINLYNTLYQSQLRTTPEGRLPLGAIRNFFRRYSTLLPLTDTCFSRLDNSLGAVHNLKFSEYIGQMIADGTQKSVAELFQSGRVRLY